MLASCLSHARMVVSPCRVAVMCENRGLRAGAQKRFIPPHRYTYIGILYILCILYASKHVLHTCVYYNIGTRKVNYKGPTKSVLLIRICLFYACVTFGHYDLYMIVMAYACVCMDY